MDENDKTKNMNPPLKEDNQSNTYHKDKEKHNNDDKDNTNENCGCPPLPPKPPHNASSCSCCFSDNIDVTYSKCQLSKTETKEITLDCTGRLLEVNVILKNICPNKFVSVGVLVYENNKLLSLKVRKLSTDDDRNCIKSLNAGKFCFVFDDSPCPASRTFTVKIVANYIEKLTHPH